MHETDEEFPRLDLSIRASILAVLAETDIALVKERLEETKQLLEALAEEIPPQYEQQKDAERFRWLCAHARRWSLCIDGLGHWRLPFTLLPHRTRSFSEAVDLAMHEEQER